jgi:alpha-ketoglutarate-dependent taurine dioxygenase
MSRLIDSIPQASGYGAYEKLSPAFRRLIDGKLAVYRSAHAYLDRNDPYAGPKYVERVHPIVRVHPATGWKSLFVNRSMTVRIIGLDKAESGIIRSLPSLLAQNTYEEFRSHLRLPLRHV